MLSGMTLLKVIRMRIRLVGNCFITVIFFLFFLPCFFFFFFLSSHIRFYIAIFLLPCMSH